MPLSNQKRSEFLCDAGKANDVARPKSSTGRCYADAYGRYPQGVLVADNGRETAQMVTKTIASSLSPFQPMRSLNDDLRVFNAAVRGVIEAVRDQVLTEEEGDAVIEMISHALASRQVDAAFMHLAAPSSPIPASFGVENAK